MKKQIKSISVFQSSKIMAAMYAVMGLLYSAVGVGMIVLGEGAVRTAGFLYLFMPIILGILGFIGFAIFAAIYNLLANSLGGVEFEVEDVEEYRMNG